MHAHVFASTRVCKHTRSHASNASVGRTCCAGHMQRRAAPAGGSASTRGPAGVVCGGGRVLRRCLRRLRSWRRCRRVHAFARAWRRTLPSSRQRLAWAAPRGRRGHRFWQASQGPQQAGRPAWLRFPEGQIYVICGLWGRLLRLAARGTRHWLAPGCGPSAEGVALMLAGGGGGVRAVRAPGGKALASASRPKPRQLSAAHDQDVYCVQCTTARMHREARAGWKHAAHGRRLERRVADECSAARQQVQRLGSPGGRAVRSQRPPSLLLGQAQAGRLGVLWGHRRRPKACMGSVCMLA